MNQFITNLVKLKIFKYTSVIFSINFSLYNHKLGCIHDVFKSSSRSSKKAAAAIATTAASSNGGHNNAGAAT